MLDTGHKLMQPSFFDLEDRHVKLDERDPLIGLDGLIDWEQFRPTIENIRKKERKSRAGRKPYDAIVMFKTLILQHLYNISDDDLEYQIRDRYSFCRFLGLAPEDKVPDAKTIWLFRESLVKAKLMRELFYSFDLQLQSRGFKARRGQIVDATFVEAPKQRNTKEENAAIKAGEIPDRINKSDAVKRQKDLDARWAKKNNETHYGYKDHIAIDNEHKLIRDYEVTAADVHDSQIFATLLSDNTSKDVWADSAYRSEENERDLRAKGYRSQVHEKGVRGRPLMEHQKIINQLKSRTRARVEHVFGSLHNEQGGIFLRTIGLARAEIKIGLMNLVYNMRRFITLHRRATSF